MQSDEISPQQQGLKRDFFNAHFIGFFFRQERIIGDHFHLQSTGPVTDDAANIARPDHTEGFAGQLNPHKFGFFPFAGMGRCAGFGDLAGDRKHHCNRMFGGGDHIAKGRVHDDHALF